MTALHMVPAWLVLVVAMVGAAAIACAGHIAVRRVIPISEIKAYNEVDGVVLVVVGTLYAVTLAFFTVVVWQQHDVSEQRAAVEAAAATDVWHMSRGLPAPLGCELRKSALQYANLMIVEEWPQMRHGKFSEKGEQTLSRMFDLVANFSPKDFRGSNAQSGVLSHLADLHDSRDHRLAANRSGISPFEWIVLLLGAAIIIVLSYLLGLENFRVQLVLTAGVAAIIASMFVLMFEFDYPFRGDLAVSATVWDDFIVEHTKPCAP